MTTQISKIDSLGIEVAERIKKYVQLPDNISLDKFTKVVQNAFIQNAELQNADKASLYISCIKAAQDGLLPDGREAALVIFNKKIGDKWVKGVQYMPMVAGIIKKIRNSGELSSITSQVVYTNDTFDYQLGDDEKMIHKPTLSERGNPICVYAIVKTKDGGVYRDLMTYADIEKIRGLSKTKPKDGKEDTSIWAKHWEEMAKKTVIRRLAKRLPMNTEDYSIVTRDDDLYTKVTPRKQVNSIVATLNAQIEGVDVTDTDIETTNTDVRDTIDSFTGLGEFNTYYEMYPDLPTDDMVYMVEKAGLLGFYFDPKVKQFVLESK